MNDRNTLTHKALAELLGVSETTVKSYRRKFPGCIPVANQGKPIRFTADAAQVALKIRDLFNLGMSVEEVRLRLAEEFAWIAATPPKEKPAKAADGGGRAAIEPELTANVSNLAKSMVTMSHRQNAILTRMQGIESMLEELGVQGNMEEISRRRKDALETAKRKEEQLEERLGSLDQTTRSLVGKVSLLAEELDRFLGKREKAAEEWRRSGGLQGLTGSANQDGLSREGQAVDGNAAKVFPLRRDQEPLPHAAQETGGDKPAEPPRRLLTLPLVVRTAQGRYISAGGRGRGRFCINDLKAVLVYGFTPPNHFVLGWEPHGQGWWLTLSQMSAQTGQADDTGAPTRTHQLLLMELPSQRDNSVVEVLQLKNNGEIAHPVEVCGLIDSFSL